MQIFINLQEEIISEENRYLGGKNRYPLKITDIWRGGETPVFFQKYFEIEKLFFKKN